MKTNTLPYMHLVKYVQEVYTITVNKTVDFHSLFINVLCSYTVFFV